MLFYFLALWVIEAEICLPILTVERDQFRPSDAFSPTSVTFGSDNVVLFMREQTTSWMLGVSMPDWTLRSRFGSYNPGCFS